MLDEASFTRVLLSSTMEELLWPNHLLKTPPLNTHIFATSEVCGTLNPQQAIEKQTEETEGSGVGGK
jgi:hypothetical protein